MNARHAAVITSLLLSPALLAAPAFAQTAPGPEAAAGERLFRARCASCHSLDAGQNRIGPTLNGLLGRKAGSVEGARYSQGMRDSGITWDAAQLQTYLANPRAMVKGTTMAIAVPAEADRAALAAYLETGSKP
ncbi:c-type cytochrome [Aquabacter cavernae]|uniref:c-type cytochrome n=1 Tax=Aquabacter cavernae TaxID=2496029 RepID=UPI000F8CD3F3|nr:c-type cytochrome [Aquabacter cavernae]